VQDHPQSPTCHTGWRADTGLCLREESPASFAYLRQGLQRYVIGRILAAKSGEIPNLEDSSSELEAILRIVA